MLDRVPKIVKNFYIMSALLFFVWMMFLDMHDLPSIFKLGSKLRSLEHEKEYYEQKIIEVQKDHDELFGTQETLEKFAREKYLMKKETEDVFVIVEE